MYAAETRIYYAILTGVLILVLMITVFVVTIIRYQRKKVALQRHRVIAEINAIEEERSRIATDLHDDLGASLSAIKLRLQCLDQGSARNNNIIRKAEFYIDEAMRKTRNISYNIMPQVLQRKGLKEALTELVDMLRETTPMRVNFEFAIKGVGKQKRIHVYRMVQEILNNIVKHAHANTVSIFATMRGAVIYLCIEDDGKGFDRNAVLKGNKGFGLQNIMARADLLNARIYLSTRPDAGVKYEIEIPANDDRREN